MAGHSQWHNIKFRKAKQDAQKSKVFTKFSKDIYFYAKFDPDAKTNISLKNIIIQAKANDVPNYVIEKAIKKATDQNIEGSKVVYECMRANYAFIVTAITNNKSRTVAEIKEVLRNYNACISKCKYLFEQFYLIKTVAHQIEDKVISLCETIEKESQFYFLLLKQKNVSEAYFLLRNVLIFSKLVFVPKNIVDTSLESEDLLNSLEDLEDVYEVFCNMYSFQM